MKLMIRLLKTGFIEHVNDLAGAGSNGINW